MTAMFDRDRIVAAIDLATLADELLGPRRGTGPSAMWPCPSPQHAQTGRTPPVSVFRTRAGEERWHCHGCGVGGSAIDLVMSACGLSVRDALEELAARAGMTGAPPMAPHVRPRAPMTAARPATVGDPAGLADYVRECADRLWRPDGRAVLRWLTDVRGLPADVLRANHIGADPGRRRGQTRPDGMPSAGWAAVLPAFEEGRPIFAQLRPIHPRPDWPRYLNAAARLTPNPRVATYEPAAAAGRCVIVTEGIVDALSANAAGYRSAAVFGAGTGEEGPAATELADRLARLGGALVIAFDADAAGDRGAQQLQRLLRERGAKSSRLHVPAEVNDLNGWALASRDWRQTMAKAVRMSFAATRPPRSLARR